MERIKSSPSSKGQEGLIPCRSRRWRDPTHECAVLQSVLFNSREADSERKTPDCRDSKQPGSGTLAQPTAGEKCGLSEDLLNDPSTSVGEALEAPGMEESELVLIQTHQAQQGGMHVTHRQRLSRAAQ